MKLGLALDESRKTADSSRIAPNLYEMSPTIWISSESTQNMHYFGASPITTVFFLEEIRVNLTNLQHHICCTD